MVFTDTIVIIPGPGDPANLGVLLEPLFKDLQATGLAKAL